MAAIGRKSSCKNTGGLWPYIFALPFIVIYMLFNLFPSIFSLFISFHDWNGISPTMKFVGLSNYIKLLTNDTYFLKSLLNTFILMIGSIPFQLIIGLLLAEFVFNVPIARRLFQTINFLPYITTPVAIGLIFAIMFEWKHGIVNTVLMSTGIIQENMNWLGTAGLSRFVLTLLLIWKYSGYHMIIFLSGMTAIPEELYEAAKIDGAGRLKTFFRITIPMLKQIIIFLVITDLIGGMQLFDESKLLFTGWTGAGLKAAGGPDRACLTAVWYFYDIAFTTTNRLGYGSAAAYLMFTVILILSFISLKLSQLRRDDA